MAAAEAAERPLLDPHQCTFNSIRYKEIQTEIEGKGLGGNR